MNLREQIRDHLRKELAQITIDDKQLTIDHKDIEVKRTSDEKFGDYTSNVALRLSSLVHRNSKSFDKAQDKPFGLPQDKPSPMEFAKELADRLKGQPYIEKLEVKEPGYLNFFIKAGFLQKEVEKVLKNGKFESKFSNQKVIIEFTDPNPFKEFHVGHLFSNSVGESISRLLET